MNCKGENCKDKKSMHYFTCHMTQEEFDIVMKNVPKLQNYVFNLINKENKTAT